MREAVVVLAPDVRAEQVVERRDRPAPRDVRRRLQPLRVLVEHRVDDVDERLVAGEEPVPAREQVALEPALAEVLGEDLHHAAVGREPLVGRLASPPSQVRPVTEKTSSSRFEAVSSGPKRRNVSRVPVDDVAQVAAEDPRRLGRARARLRHVDRVVAEVGQHEVAEQLAAVRVRVGAHPPPADAARAPELGHEAAALVEQLLGPVAPKPLPRAAAGARGCRGPPRAAPGASARCPRPACRRPPSARSSPSASAGRASASADARPRSLARALARISAIRSSASSSAAANRRCTRRRILAVEATGDEQRLPAVALEQRHELVLRDPREDRRVRDLVAVQVQDREHGAVACAG